MIVSMKIRSAEGTARGKFPYGCRVVLSDRGKKHLWHYKITTGTVIAVPHFNKYVGVVLDGQVTRWTYHMDLWDVVDDLA